MCLRKGEPNCKEQDKNEADTLREAEMNLSMEFSRHEYWSGLPFPSPRDLPNPGIEPGSPALKADSLLTEL